MTEQPSSNAAKYATRNPLARGLIGRFLDRVAARVEALGPRTVLDLGCGEGFVAERLLRSLPTLAYRGVDRSERAVAEARSRSASAAFEVADVLSPACEPGGADLVLALELLEHLAPEDAAALVRRMAAWAPRALVSVPWEPWFRLATLARGRHLGRLGLHPEHVQQLTPRTLRRLLEPGYRVVTIARVFPWLLAEASP